MTIIMEEYYHPVADDNDDVGRRNEEDYDVEQDDDDCLSDILGSSITATPTTASKKNEPQEPEREREQHGKQQTKMVAPLATERMTNDGDDQVWEDALDEALLGSHNVSVAVVRNNKNDTRKTTIRTGLSDHDPTMEERGTEPPPPNKVRLLEEQSRRVAALRERVQLRRQQRFDQPPRFVREDAVVVDVVEVEVPADEETRRSVSSLSSFSSSVVDDGEEERGSQDAKPQEIITTNRPGCDCDSIRMETGSVQANDDNHNPEQGRDEKMAQPHQQLHQNDDPLSFRGKDEASLQQEQQQPSVVQLFEKEEEVVVVVPKVEGNGSRPTTTTTTIRSKRFELKEKLRQKEAQLTRLRNQTWLRKRPLLEVEKEEEKETMISEAMVVSEDEQEDGEAPDSGSNSNNGSIGQKKCRKRNHPDSSPPFPNNGMMSMSMDPIQRLRLMTAQKRKQLARYKSTFEAARNISSSS